MSWFQRHVMACEGIVLVGIISYPLYLWHWPLLSFATILESGTPEGAVRVTAVLTSLVLAWLTYRFIEYPIRTQRSTHVAAGLAGLLLMTGAAGLIVYAGSGFANRFDEDVRAMRPERRTNSLCTDRFAQIEDFNYCKSTSPRQTAVLFLGDSQAQAIYDGTVAHIGASESMLLLGRGGCPPLLNVRDDNARD